MSRPTGFGADWLPEPSKWTKKIKIKKQKTTNPKHKNTLWAWGSLGGVIQPQPFSPEIHSLGHYYFFFLPPASAANSPLLLEIGPWYESGVWLSGIPICESFLNKPDGAKHEHRWGPGERVPLVRVPRSQAEVSVARPLGTAAKRFQYPNAKRRKPASCAIARFTSAHSPSDNIRACRALKAPRWMGSVPTEEALGRTRRGWHRQGWARGRGRSVTMRCWASGAGETVVGRLAPKQQNLERVAGLCCEGTSPFLCNWTRWYFSIKVT